jgi:hypothetical protein
MTIKMSGTKGPAIAWVAQAVAFGYGLMVIAALWLIDNEQ